MVNLHLVVKISTGHNSRTVWDIKKFFFLWLSFSKSGEKCENKEILKRRVTNIQDTEEI